MPSLTVEAEAYDPSRLPASWEDDLRTAIERAGGSGFVVGKQAETSKGAVVPFMFSVDADDENDAEAKARDVVSSVIGRHTWGIVRD